MPPSCFIACGKLLSFRLLFPDPPSFFARDRAYRNPHLRGKREKGAPYDGVRGAYALHKSFFPLGPFLHSGLWVTLQLEHF